MKKLLFLAFVSIALSASTLCARVIIPAEDAKHLPVTQGEIIPLTVIQNIADRNAAEVWGEVQGTEPIPYYWIDGEVIAYRCMSSKPFAPFVMCDSAVCNVVDLAL